MGRVEFRRVQARLRKCVMLATHDVGQAMALGDRVASSTADG